MRQLLSFLGTALLFLFSNLVVMASAAKLTADLPPDAPLRIGVLHRVQCERKTQSGDTLSMHYTGTVVDGTKFDSSLDRNEPFTFTLGQGQVIKGWDQGLLNMCVGDKRRLTIPSDMGYGDHGSGDVIKGGATLIFEVELMAINEGGSGAEEDAYGGGEL